MNTFIEKRLLKEIDKKTAKVKGYLSDRDARPVLNTERDYTQGCIDTLDWLKSSIKKQHELYSKLPLECKACANMHGDCPLPKECPCSAATNSLPQITQNKPK